MTTTTALRGLRAQAREAVADSPALLSDTEGTFVRFVVEVIFDGLSGVRDLPARNIQGDTTRRLIEFVGSAREAGTDVDTICALLNDAIAKAEFIRLTNECQKVVAAIEPDFRKRTITFGYIGNVDVGGANDDRSWTVFDSTGRENSMSHVREVGYFRTGDVKGAERALTYLISINTKEL